MSYVSYQGAGFGSGRGGLTTVGYRVYDASNAALGPRTTTGVQDIGAGNYAALVTFPDGFQGRVEWDTGGGSPLYANSFINPPPVQTGIADAVLDALAADHNDAGTIGALLNKLDVGAPSDPVLVVPGVPPDVSLCRVYGFFETLQNVAAEGVSLTFQLITPAAVKSNRVIVGRVVKASIVGGLLTDGAGNAYLDLQRNDHLTPAGSTYQVSCAELGWKKKSFTLAADLFDLASLIT